MCWWGVCICLRVCGCIYVLEGVCDRSACDVLEGIRDMLEVVAGGTGPLRIPAFPTSDLHTPAPPSGGNSHRSL